MDFDNQLLVLKHLKVLVHGRFLFVSLCLTSLQQRGHLETAPPFTVTCEGREAR